MNTYEIITNKILDAMKTGSCPWHKPWKSTSGLDYTSFSTGKPYSFLNSMLLMVQGKDPGEFLTFKQCKQLGGKIKKGAQSAMVCFFSQVEKKYTKEDGTEGKERYPVLRWYLVFHTKDCEGIDPKKVIEPLVVNDDIEPIEAGEKILNDYLHSDGAPKFRDNGERAFYSAGLDEICVPNINRYDNPAEHYSTAFHEAVHSTGHHSRLNRKFGNMKTAARGKDYSREELVAEIGSAYLCHAAGIEDKAAFDNSVAYLQGWMKHLADNPKDFVVAAGRAEKAAQYILGERNND